MPVKEHRCPHCGNSTTYIKDYRLQTVRDLVVLGKPLIVTIRKRGRLYNEVAHLSE